MDNYGELTHVNSGQTVKAKIVWFNNSDGSGEIITPCCQVPSPGNGWIFKCTRCGTEYMGPHLRHNKKP